MEHLRVQIPELTASLAWQVLQTPILEKCGVWAFPPVKGLCWQSFVLCGEWSKESWKCTPKMRLFGRKPLLSRNKGNWPVFGGSLRLGIPGFRAGSGFVLNPLVWDLGKTLCALWDVYGKQSQEETCHNFVFEVCAFELFKHVGCECSA